MTVVSIPFDGWAGLVAVGSDTELAGNGYTRQPAHFEYCADGVTIANLAAIQWDKATLDWGDIDLVDIWDSATGGNLLGSMTTAVIIDVFQYAIARIPPAGIAGVRVPALRTFGTGTFGVGRYATAEGIQAAGTGVPTAYGVPAPYGIGPYGTTSRGVLLEITFDTSQHVCEPGIWSPGPFKWAA
jgi:hypothetical protein